MTDANRENAQRNLKDFSHKELVLLVGTLQRRLEARRQQLDRLQETVQHFQQRTPESQPLSSKNEVAALRKLSETAIAHDQKLITDLKAEIEQLQVSLARQLANVGALKEENGRLRIVLRRIANDPLRENWAGWRMRAEIADKALEGSPVETNDTTDIDAARYRWLRSQKHADIASCWILPSGEPAVKGDELDAAIDRARTAQKTDGNRSGG